MFTLDKKLPSEAELKELLPFKGKETKNVNDVALCSAIKERSKFVVVCGPCSADNSAAVKEYCEKLARLNEKISPYVLLVPRIFTAKPRSKGEGYLGMLFSANESGKPDVEKGLIECRKLLIQCAEITKLPIADELLYLEQYVYFSDIISYYFLGARTSESTVHRDFVSGISQPVGIKNNTGGDISALSQSVYCASQPKTFLVSENQYSTDGNKLSHAVLRGYVREGEHFSNLNAETVLAYGKILPESCIDFILADCSHSNSGKQPQRQISNAFAALTLDCVGGIMLESYLYTGCGKGYGYSITDPCLGFVETERLLLQLCEKISKK